MKFALSVALLSAFALAACETDEPPARNVRRGAAKYPTQNAQQYPPQPQPFQEGGAPQQPGPVTEAQPVPSESTTTTTTAPAEKTQAAAKGDYPYGVPVPGKPGFVRSPYSPDKMTDVRGYAPGTEVKDPYTNKIFLVP